MYCPVCHSISSRAWPVEKQEGDSAVVYWISACDQCGALFDQRCASVDHAADERSQALVNHDYYQAAFNEQEYEERLTINRGMIEHFSRFARDRATFVEIGMGLGFLTRAAGHVFERAIGLDLEIETATQSGPLPANVEFHVHGDFLAQTEGGISALCAWHVVEHLPDPLGVLSPLFRRMPSGSIFFGQVPLYRQEYVFAAHYVFHNERSLGAMVAGHGFHPVYFERDEVNQFLSFCFRKG